VLVAGASLIAVPATASAATAPADSAAPPVVPDERVVMDDFAPADYAAEAAAVPPELAAAIQNGLGVTPAEYYANAEAAARAVQVVDQLESDGADVLSSRVEGTELVVNVADDADVAAVEAVGATAEIGAPAAEPLRARDGFRLLRDLVGGQGYYSYDGTYEYSCSVGFNGRDLNSTAAQFLTAGHCYGGYEAYELKLRNPGDQNGTGGDLIGYPVGGSAYLGNGYDSSLFSTDTGIWTPKASVGTWNGNQGPVYTGPTVSIRDYSRAIVGQGICKSGIKTGWTCGTVTEVDAPIDFSDGTWINGYVSTMCALPGDSGGAVMSGAYAIGLLSAGSFQNGCGEPGEETLTFPLDSSQSASVRRAEPNWELAVEVAEPVSAQLGGGVPVYRSATITGYVSGGGNRFSVNLTVDGTRQYTVPVSANGTWSADIVRDLSNGTHTFSMYTSYASGRFSQSNPSTGTFVVADRPLIDRIEGPSRFEVAVAVANKAFPTTAPVVYVATGTNYPDALSAGPAAVKQGGPLLLVRPDGVPDVVAAKITALAPARIVIVGGPASVGAAVEAQLAGLVPDVEVERISGADRFAASRNVVEYAFGEEGSAHAYAATGTNFPDALSAGGAAGSKLEPVTLVNGPAPTADAPTLDMFRTLETSSVTIVGGPNSVSTGVEQSLRSGIPATVDRVAGADRFQASIALNRSAFTSASTVYLATGYNFPDALAGGVLAGSTDSPLYVVPGDCVPRGVLADITRLGATKVTLLGGPASLNLAVGNLSPCAF
jgi:putative cell wall-binding protein